VFNEGVICGDNTVCTTKEDVCNTKESTDDTDSENDEDGQTSGRIQAAYQMHSLTPVSGTKM